MTVTDATGCTATAVVEITEDILPLSVNVTQGQGISCAGAGNGSVNAEIDGGKRP